MAGGFACVSGAEGGDEIHTVRMPVLWLDVVSPSESKLLL